MHNFDNRIHLSLALKIFSVSAYMEFAILRVIRDGRRKLIDICVSKWHERWISVACQWAAAVSLQRNVGGKILEVGLSFLLRR
jgi:hypothetical protein